MTGPSGRSLGPTPKQRVPNAPIHDRPGLESHVPQQAQPPRARKEALDMAIVHHACPAPLVADHDREIDHVSRIGGGWGHHPPPKTDTPPLGGAPPLGHLPPGPLPYPTRGVKHHPPPPGRA